MVCIYVNFPFARDLIYKLIDIGVCLNTKGKYYMKQCPYKDNQDKCPVSD